MSRITYTPTPRVRAWDVVDRELRLIKQAMDSQQVMHSGQGAPAATIGKAGDWYIDFTNRRLYGPKGAADWPTTFLLFAAP